MSTDRTVEDTFYTMFTTRALTGIPTLLSGTPVVSIYEDGSTTQITAGITLGVSHDSVVGMNLLTIVATGANGYEAGKDYNIVVTTGTVDGVSVVGEVIGQFSLSLSAAAKGLIAGVDVISISGDSGAADNLELDYDGTGYAKANSTIGTATTVTGGATSAEIATAQADLDIITGADGVNLLTATQASIDAIEVDTGTTLPSTLATAQADLDIITGADGVNLLSATQASIDAIEVDTAEIGSAVGASISADIAAVQTDTTAIKAKTDSLTFTTANIVDSNIQQINDTTITGNGGAGTEFGV